ncbi:MAG: hypothetical protein QF441_00600 [Bacteriovoracaceae bacterium]|jgi:hypothetical protein|nr:hypothetical protein [Bacteriovoracaceae bacterium]
MKWLALFTLLFLSTNLFAQKAKKALSKEEFEQKRWNNIYRLITEEIETINKVRRKSQKLLYRLFELKSEKVKLYKEKENKEFLAKKLKYGNKIKRKDIFKRTLKLYNHANNYGLGLLRKYPNTKYKAAIYYTLALNSRDFSYDNKELGYLRKAIQYSTGQSQVNYLARTSLAEYYYNNKKWKSAIYQYNTVLKNQDDEWYTKNLLNYGWCLLKDQKFGKAIDSLEKSYKLSRDEFYVDVREQSMTGLISFYVLGKEIKRGVNFIEKFSHNKHESLLKLAQKASGKGFYKETQEIIASLESRISPKKETELYADMRLFQFDLYKQYHKPKKLLTIAKIFPKVVFTDYQKEEAIRKVSEVVGAKQVILKKDYSKYNQEYDRKTLNEIITYFDILSAVNKPEKAQYEFFQAETYYSVQLFEDALKTYKKSIATYEQNQSKEDLRHKNLDAVFSCIDVMKLTKKEKANELEFAYNKYLSYWPSDKKAQKIYPRLFNLYVVRKDYKNMQISLDRYIKHFKTDKKEQKDLYRVQLDMLIKDENTELLANKITSMQKGYLNFKKTEIKKSETILANILFKQFQKLNEEGKSKDAIAGYQKIHYTNYYPDSIKGEAAFNMGMIYTDIEDNHNAFKWYKKSFKFLTDKEIRAKRDFLEKMALRTSLLHNFLNAAKLDKFILENFCSDKNKNLAIFTNAIRNDLANDYITKALYTYDSYQKCITKVPKELKHEIMVHLFENKHESTFMSFVSDNKLHKVFPKDVSFYYERLFWKYYGNNRSKEVQYFNAFKRLKNKNSKLLIKSMRYYKRLQRDINRFQKDIISIPKKDPNPNLFINKLTARINRLKALNEKANKIFDMGHGQVSVLVYDELTKLSASFAQEVDNYSMPIDDKDFQRQFKTEMYKISSNMLKESHSFKDKSQTLIEKYELLIVKRDESDVANEILNIADIRTPASNMAITFGLGK